MSLETDKDRGDAAKALLADPTFADACAKVEKGIQDAWAVSLSPEDRERLWLSQRLLAKIRAAIVGTVRTGEFAVQQLLSDERAKAATRYPKPRGK